MKKCRLCENEFENLCRAHIIPDFMYRELGLFNDQHRVQTLRMQNGKVIKGHRPTGEYDQNILCSSCDGDIIGVYEDYARNAIFSTEPTGISVERQVNGEGINSFLISNLKYKEFKLFLLSLLWRASISTQQFFDQVKLTQEDEDKIRDMLRSGEPGLQLEYPCVVWTHVKLDLPTDYILSPISQTKDNFTSYYFPIGGNVFIFIVGNTDVAGSRDLAINEDGVTRWPEFRSTEDVEKLIGVNIKR